MIGGLQAALGRLLNPTKFGANPLQSNLSSTIIKPQPQAQPKLQPQQQNFAPIGPRLPDGSFYKDNPNFIGPRLPDGRISQLHSAPVTKQQVLKQPIPKTTDISFNDNNSGSNSSSAYSNIDSSVSKKNQENVSSELSQYEADRQAELQRQVEEEKKKSC